MGAKGAPAVSPTGPLAGTRGPWAEGGRGFRGAATPLEGPEGVTFTLAAPGGAARAREGPSTAQALTAEACGLRVSGIATHRVGALAMVAGSSSAPAKGAKGARGRAYTRASAARDGLKGARLNNVVGKNKEWSRAATALGPLPAQLQKVKNLIASQLLETGHYLGVRRLLEAEVAMYLALEKRHLRALVRDVRARNEDALEPPTHLPAAAEGPFKAPVEAHPGVSQLLRREVPQGLAGELLEVRKRPV